MFKTIILICSVSVPVPDCTQITADHVTRLPDDRSLAACMQEGMLVSARLGYYEKGKNYPKIICSGK